MFETKAAGFSRTFYLAAVLIWSGAVALMFITAVWGGFYGMMDAMMAGRESKHLAQNLPEPTQQSAPHAPLAPNPFEQPQTAQTPLGWTVNEVEKALAALELRTEKLLQQEFGPDKPQPPTIAVTPPVQSAPEVRQQIKQPEPKREPSGPPLMQGELGVVKGVKYEPGEGRFLMTIQTTAPPDKVSYFYLDNPRRLAVNLQGAWRNTAPRNADFATGPIAKAAVGEHPDYVRVTLHFRDPNAPKPADPTITKLKDALGVSLTTTK
ncbi:MAG: AMIN domain-containing protein [Acidobacteriota bacterium]